MERGAAAQPEQAKSAKEPMEPPGRVASRPRRLESPRPVYPLQMPVTLRPEVQSVHYELLATAKNCQNHLKRLLRKQVRMH